MTFGIFLGIFTKELRIHSLLEAGVKSYLCLSTLVVVSTEFFSALVMLSRQGLILFWLTECITGVLIFILSGRRLSIWQVPKRPQHIELTTLLLIAALVFILFATFAAPLLFPPNNWESMTYHM